MTTANTAQAVLESIEFGSPSATTSQMVLEAVEAALPLSETSQTVVEVILLNQPYRLTMTTLKVTQFNMLSSNHYLSLRYSDDGGASWSNAIERDMGQVGAYETSIQFRRLGMARNRVVELSWSGEYATALNGAFIEFEIAQT